jgi:Tetracyclin repressor-like, C-terminal domain
VLFWVHDRSPDAARTRLLVDRTVPIVARLVRLSRLPLLRPLARQVVDVVRLLRS